MASCKGTFKKSGKSCHFKADADRDFCLLHDEERREELRVEMSKRGKNGRERVKAASEEHRRRGRVTCSLRSAGDLLVEYERALIALEQSKGDVVDRESAKLRILIQAREVLDLERRNQELKRFLVEMRPDLAEKVKAL